MVSAIGRGIMAVFSGIASILNAIVSVCSVRLVASGHSARKTDLCPFLRAFATQAIVSVFTTFFHCLGDVLCCRCGGRGRRGGKV
jgi:hypothetical protein